MRERRRVRMSPSWIKKNLGDSLCLYSVGKIEGRRRRGQQRRRR